MALKLVAAEVTRRIPAGHLNLTEGTVKAAVHRLRQRFRELLCAEVARTVARPEGIDGELRHLISVAS